MRIPLACSMQCIDIFVTGFGNVVYSAYSFCVEAFWNKRVMLIAMLAWVLRFGLFGLGNPGSGVWMFVLSMIVYGVAFDFFNISGSLFVNKETDLAIRSSAQGLFVIMTNGIGATVGTLSAQMVVNIL